MPKQARSSVIHGKLAVTIFLVYKESDLVADPLGASSKLVMLVRFSPMIAIPGQGRPQSRARDAAPDREGKTGARLPTYVRLVIRRSVLSPEPEAPVGLGCLVMFESAAPL